MGNRIEHYTGNVFYPTWLDSYDIGALQQQVSDILYDNGWGVQTLVLSKDTFWTAISLSGAYFNVDLYIDNSTNQNPENIRTALQNSLSQMFPSVTLNYSGSNIYSVNPVTGQTDITNAYNDKTPQPKQLSVWQQLFGNESVTDVAKSGTLSFTTIAIILGVGYVLISSRKK